MKTDIELVPGAEWEPLFSLEEYEAFRQWWQEHVVPELKKQDEARARSLDDSLHRPPLKLAA